MKIISFNILQGGIDHRGSRLDCILGLLKKQSADFIALQEANRFDVDEDNWLQVFSEQLNLPYSALSRAPAYRDGLRYHVASLSRFPIIDKDTFSTGEFQSAALSTLIEMPCGPISITNIHLHDASEDARLKEIELVLKSDSSDPRQIILGDFNAISRLDGYQESTLECEARYEVTELVGRDYIDIFGSNRNYDATHPGPINMDKRFTRPRRIDYCFAKPGLAGQLKHCEVIQDSQSDLASDHFPILVEFDL